MIRKLQTVQAVKIIKKGKGIQDKESDIYSHNRLRQ